MKSASKKKSRRRRAFINTTGKGKKPDELIYLSDPLLFDEEEPTFTNYGARRRIKVYLVRAPWSRVVLLSLLYALLISMAKFAYFYTFGKPQLVASQPVVEISK